MAHHATSQINEAKPDCFQPFGGPPLGQHQSLHEGIQVEGEDRDPPLGGVGAEAAGGQVTASQVLLHDFVYLLPFATPHSMPPDKIVPRDITVSHHTKHFVLSFAKAHAGKGKLDLQSRELRLLQQLANG